MPATITGRLRKAGAILANTDFVIEVLELHDDEADHTVRETTHTTNGSANFTLSLYAGRYSLNYGPDKTKLRIPDSIGSYTVDQVYDLNQKD